MRLLLLKSAAVSFVTVLLLWEMSDLFYPSDAEYWRTEAQGMCVAWEGLPGLLDGGAALAGQPAVTPDGVGALSVDCGGGLRVRSGREEFEALLQGPGGAEHLVAATTTLWAEETVGERLYLWVCVLLAGAVAWMLVWPLIGRTRELEAVAGAIAEGDLDARATPGGPAELNSLARSINTMADRVSGHIRARQVTLRAVAHEMGQPLTQLRFALELLRTSDEPASRERQLARLEESADRLEALSVAVLGQLKVERTLHRMSPQRVAVAPLVEATVNGVEPGAVTVVTELSPVTAQVDPEMIRIALRNLVENAVRHAAARVVVRLDDAGVTVDDDGPGLEPGAHEALLQPFVQGADSGAMGLGLPIAADVARMHGGTLHLLKAPTGGARVRLTWVAEG